MAHSFGMDIGAFEPTLARRVTFAAAFATVCVLALQMAGVGQSVAPAPAARSAAPQDAAQAAHCSQFVELARAKFGAEWKRRLDPRDTACAEQIQQAWERDWRPRDKTPPEPVLRPQITASTAPPSKIAPAEEAPAYGSKTYALAAVTNADASAVKPADQDASAAKPADQDASAAKPARQETSTADAADQNASAPAPAGQEDATDSSNTSEYDHPSSAFEDSDQDAMVADDDGPDGHAFSRTDNPDDETRTLNSEQLGRGGRYDDDMQPPPYDDSEIYEDDGGVYEDDDVGE